MPRSETASPDSGKLAGEKWPLADEYKPREERIGLIPYSKFTLLPGKE
jgi:hypothetical protein